MRRLRELRAFGARERPRRREVAWIHAAHRRSGGRPGVGAANDSECERQPPYHVRTTLDTVRTREAAPSRIALLLRERKSSLSPRLRSSEGAPSARFSTKRQAS